MSGKKPVQPQPPKMPKQHTTRSTSQAQNPGPLVPFPSSQRTQPVSSSSVANRYLVSTIPKPNYQRPQGQHSYSSALYIYIHIHVKLSSIDKIFLDSELIN